MPLLPAEPMLYPDHLFAAPFAEAVPDECGRWWVYQTRPKSEKAFARLLLKSETAFFLPQYTNSWRKNGRSFQSRLPLFPGYVFVFGAQPAREAAFATNFVVREITVSDQPQFARELASVRTLLGGGGAVRPEETLPRGLRVKIAEGSFAGVEGRVLETVEGLRVCVEITLLGQGVSVAVDRWMIRPLEQPEPAASEY